MSDSPKLDWVIRTSEVDGGRQHHDYWGDDYLWTSMLPIAWTLIDIPGISIRPRKGQNFGKSQQEHAIAQWSMAIHLLALGMGWGDIALGLRNWRLNSYAIGFHPILDFLYGNFGEEIKALEIYFGVSPRTEIGEALQCLTNIERSPRGWSFDESWASKYALMRDQLLEAESKLGKSAKSLGYLLLDGGDALHLDSHCGQTFVHRGHNAMGMDAYQETYGGLSARTPFYDGWVDRLSMYGAKAFEPDAKGFYAEIHIQGAGYIGRFVWNAQSRRWFRESLGYRGMTWQVDAHLWGHRL